MSLAAPLAAMLPLVHGAGPGDTWLDSSGSGSSPDASGNMARRIGRYRLLEVLGRGGMGVVYLAEEEPLGRQVAIKVVARELLADPEALRRFQREAETAASISHPGVMKIHAAGEHGGLRYLVFDYCPGGSLADRLKKQGAIPWREAARLGAAVARGLAAVHAAGLIHRDVKPANILLDGEGRPKLADFGLVRRKTAGQSIALTAAGEVLGSPLYMPPEQSLSLPVDARSDLYALGATLFALLVGEPPFDGTAMEIMEKHVHEAPPSPSERAADLPRAFEELVLALMAKAPEDRPRTATEVAETLEALAHREGDGAKPGLSRATLALLGVALVACMATLALVVTRRASQVAAVKLSSTPSSSPSSSSPSPRPTSVAAIPSEAGPAAPAYRLAATIGSRRFRQAGDIDAVACSADGARALSTGYDWVVRLWDAATGEPLASLQGHTGRPTVLAFSSDGRCALSGAHDKTARVWDLEGRRELHAFPHAERVSAVAFAGSRAITGDEGGLIRVFDAGTGAHLQTYQAHKKPIRSIAVADDRLVTAGDDGRVCVLDLESGRELRRFEGLRVAAVAGGRAVVFTEETVLLVDLETAAILRTHAPKEFDLQDLAVSADGRRALLLSDEGAVRVLDVETGTERVLAAPEETETVAVSADGRRLLTGGSDGLVRSWDGETLAELAAGPGHHGDVNQLAVSPDGALIASSADDGLVRLWQGGTERLAAPGAGVAFTADGRRLLVGGPERLDLIELTEPGTKRSIDARATRIACAQDSVHALVAGERGLGLLDLVDGTVVPLAGHTGEVHAVAFAPDGRRAFSAGADAVVRVWSVPGGALEKTIPLEGSAVYALAVSRDGERLVVGDASGRLLVRELGGGTDRSLEAHKYAIRGLSFSQDGERIVVGSEDGTVVVLSARTGHEIATNKLDDGDYPTAVASLPSGGFVVGTARGLLLRFEPATPLAR